MSDGSEEEGDMVDSNLVAYDFDTSDYFVPSDDPDSDFVPSDDPDTDFVPSDDPDSDWSASEASKPEKKKLSPKKKLQKPKKKGTEIISFDKNIESVMINEESDDDADNDDQGPMLECYDCGYKCLRKQPQNLVRHMVKHTEVKPYKCNQCDYSTVYASGLKSHKASHIRNSDWSASEASKPEKKKLSPKKKLQKPKKKGTEIISFDKNIESVMINEESDDDADNDDQEVKPYKCNQCDYSTVYASGLKSHKASHIRNSDWSASEASKPEKKKLSSKKKLQKPKKKGTEIISFDKNIESVMINEESDDDADNDDQEVKLYKCDQCHFSSVYASGLKKHKASHIPSGQQFHCARCTYKTCYRSALVRHMKLHADSNDFACNICDFRSNFQPELTKHMLIHTGRYSHCCAGSGHVMDLDGWLQTIGGMPAIFVAGDELLKIK